MIGEINGFCHYMIYKLKIIHLIKVDAYILFPSFLTLYPNLGGLHSLKKHTNASSGGFIFPS
jgi:hypothetical protein